MTITRVTTEHVRPAGQGLVVAAEIEGEGLSLSAAPLIVKFGSTAASHVVPLVTSPGVRAVFSEMPTPGSVLFIGFLDEPLEETVFRFVDPVA